MTDRTYIYVAEAYDRHGERVERVAHTNRESAEEDIEILASWADEDWITNVCPLQLYGGDDGVVTGIKTAEDT